jgi:hypothetical protein
LTIASGCNFLSFDKETYVAPGQAAEIASPVTARCWVKNKKTGKYELRHIKAQAGWYIGRLKEDADRGAD